MVRENKQHICERLSYFRSAYRPRRRLARGPVDAIPLVDIALIVILFLLINSSFVLQPGILVSLPEAPFAAGARYGSMVVTISQENMVFFNNERVMLNDLSTAFRKARYQDPEATLVIEADGRVPHSALVDIYNMAMKVGIREVAIATRMQTNAGSRANGE